MPSISPVTLEMLRMALDADPADNALLEQYNAAAVGWIEDNTSLLLSPQEIVQDFDGLVRRAYLRRWPVTGVASVSYLDAAGAPQDLPNTAFRYVAGDAPPATLVTMAALPRMSDSAGSVSVTYTAGFPTTADVPATVVQAVYLLVGEFFRNREAGAISADATGAISALLRRYRRRTL